MAVSWKKCQPGNNFNEVKRETARVHTRMSIEKHHKEKTFVQTNAVDKALAGVKQNGIVVLIGSPGIGKSRIGLELLQQLSSGDQGYTAIQLDDVSQWSDLICSMDAVFIDDLFGRTNCHYDDNVYPRLLETIITAAEKGNVKVIITVRNSIYRTVADITAGRNIFHSQHIVDLGAKKLQMTVEEKTSILLNYLTINRIFVTDDPKKENISDCSINDASLPVYLHTKTLQNILLNDQGTSIGFPETCYLFASHRKFTQTGLNFFFHPTELLYREIDNLMREGNVNFARKVDFTLLVYILLHGDSFDTYSIDLDIFGKIMTTVYLNPSPVVPFSYIDDAIKRLTGIYLKINSISNYCFQHRLISEAVLKSYSAADPRRIIPVLGFDFITEMTRPQFFQGNEGEIFLPVPVHCYSVLAQRVLRSLELYNRPFHVVQNLCKSKIIRLTGKGILQEMVIQYKFNIFSRAHHYMESLQNHQLSGGIDHFTVFQKEFYLPSALIMFCNVDNDSVNQCLYDCIHNTMISASDIVVHETCQETLLTSLNFALCTLNLKRSSLIMEILEDAHLKYDVLPLCFFQNIVDCGGLPAVHLMLTLPTLGHVFNITSLLRQIFKHFLSCKISINDNMKQFITSVIVSNSHESLPVEAIMEFVCKHGQLDFVKNVCAKFHGSLLNVDGMIKGACEGANIKVVLWLIDEFCELRKTSMVLDDEFGNGSISDGQSKLQKSYIEIAMIHACQNGTTELVKYLFERFGHHLFDIKSVMDCACSRRNTELVQWLFDVFDPNLFDVKSAMNNACESGDSGFVKWMCEKIDNHLFDVKSAINNALNSRNTRIVQLLGECFPNQFDAKLVMKRACSSGDSELIRLMCENFNSNVFDMKSVMDYACSIGDCNLVKWIFEKFDNTFFDMKSVMECACNNGDSVFVKWLCEKVDNNLFDMKSVMDYACSSRNTELVKWLCEKFDINLFDMKSAMNYACSSRNTELVKWLCEMFDPNLFDMKSAMNYACSSRNTELVKWLCEKFNIDLFDMKSAMNYVCSSQNAGLVKWLCENFNKHTFDMKSVMNYACSSEESAFVEWLCENFDSYVFDMKTAMNYACSSGSSKLLKALFERFDNNLFDVKTAMNYACCSGRSELVKWLFEKVDNNLFNMKSCMNCACQSGDSELVKWLCEKFDHEMFDMESAFDHACKSRNPNLVKWLYEKFDNNLLNIKSIRNCVYSSGESAFLDYF